jgi:ElaB/YqjD/DUF883 family membrane-anchored ribosome-binding protein
MDESKDARTEVEDSRQRIGEITDELAHRFKPQYMKQRAKEAAVRETRHLKDRIIDSPIALGVIGGLVTAGIARLFRGRIEERRYGYAGYDLPEYEEPGIRERAREKLDEIKEGMSGQAEHLKETAGQWREQAKETAGHWKEQAEHLKERASDFSHRVSDRIPSAEELKVRARDAKWRAENYVGEEPLVGALAALAAGAALGLMLPLTSREREVLTPYREKAEQKLSELGRDVKDQVEALGEKIRGEEGAEEKSADREPLFSETELKPTLQ